MNLHRKLRILGVLLLMAGLLGIAPLGYFFIKNNAFAQSPTPVNRPVLHRNTIVGHPSRIMIPSLNISLGIVDGNYDAQSAQWTLTLDKAQFATLTTPPNNESGNTLIYGHYRPEVFASLHRIKPGAQAIIDTDNGYQFKYSFSRTEAIEPTDTSVFSYKGSPRLTIQTCSGSFFQHRQMYFFRYESYKKTS